MKMKAVCEATGLTDRTIRYYIEEELIAPAYTENYLGRKTFDFSQSDIDALRDIAVLRKFGFSLVEIKQMRRCPEEIVQISNMLQERKQALINEETVLLQVLSRLDKTNTSNVSELANHLRAPVADAPLPKEDVSVLGKFMRRYAIIRLAMILLGIGISIAGLVISLYIPIEHTEKTDIADYGTYSGTYADDIVQAYIDSFFPETISTSFQDIKYSYKAEKLDTYAFEAYLEFSIEDAAEFYSYIYSVAPENAWRQFPFDENFMEYSIDNRFDISTHDSGKLTCHSIEYAGIKKILYCTQTQTIIYVAIGVHDGGGVGTDYLCVFFERFGIDPVVYEQIADSA